MLLFIKVPQNNKNVNTKIHCTMDIKREKKTGWKAIFQKKYLPYLFGAVFLIFVAILLLRSNASVLRVSADVVTISNVEKGEFNDYVRLTSTAQPITTVQLSPLETGVVERIVAEEGTKVRRGDVIVENRQAIEMTSIYRDIINGTRELMSSVIDNRLNNAMKYLTSITIVMAIPTVISGIYGMNVDEKWMPFADTPHGFLIICVLTLLICIITMLFLRKKRML